MSAPALFCGAAEVALNRYLRLEPAVLEECAALDGRSIEFMLPTAGVGLCLEFMPAGVRVMPEAATTPDVRVSGSAGALLAALRQLGSADAGLPAGLQLEGDAELLNRFRAMVRRVGFDPEEWLAPLLGGAAAHRVLGGLRSLFGWSRENTRRFADHSAEYLREETYDLARGRDVDGWMDEVDRTRESLDRLEARLRRLEAAANSAGKPD